MSIKTSVFIIQSQIRTYALKRQLKRIYKKILLLPIVDFIFPNYA
jgi:hypothetical protein